MSLTRSLQLLAVSAGIVAACPELHKRQSGGVTERTWLYENANDWARQDPAWETCQTGTQQSPLSLRVGESVSRLASGALLDIDYPTEMTGELTNWGYGPSYALDHAEGDYTTLPAITFSENGVNETVYLASWHTHTPSEHTVDGTSTKAELHFVHYTAAGKPRAVLGFRIDHGVENSTFFNQLPPMIPLNDTTTAVPGVVLNPMAAVQEVDNFDNFWTYQGSLTTPPCTEGKRWFVAQEVMSMSDEQMQALLKVSAFSARPSQELWNHAVEA
ncbi:related to carbonic anhydrase precursor [Ramularia collo-cygni]|uniref:Related to carbonic anhydrase n=1 Tax=Ramularia collo-cygni TaxID=112498 RepID=A0A2D3USV2_9PEZI|nr:related to carbonic anhydrase precursor [Ramularia collo-cygni]CZT20472.1 related to carbonic anhydrase precursor [Ramularia collo-cygni]